MILHYSLAILNTNDNALSLLFFANAPMSDQDSAFFQLINQNQLPRINYLSIWLDSYGHFFNIVYIFEAVVVVKALVKYNFKCLFI